MLTLGNIKDFDKYFIGFDDQIGRLAKLHDEITKNIPNYPPYNIKKVEDNKYVIEIAVAGFSKSEIEVEFDGDKLIVKGNATDDDQSEWLHKGIATRNFSRTFALNDQVEIKGASMVNGMLKIALERLIPEHKKARKVDIEDESTYPRAEDLNPQLLTEQDVEVIASTPVKKTRVKK